jgi:predicted  nucleic acid-binding Zn-ribbon protein
MSFLDRVTKAVGDVVDRGKKEVDQFVRIQKVNGQIGEIEKKITAFKDQIQQTKVQIGEKAVEMLRAGTLASPDLRAMVDRISGLEHQIGAERAEIVEKKEEIEKIKAEDKAQSPAPAEGAQPSAPAETTQPATVAGTAEPVTPPETTEPVTPPETTEP